MDFIHCSQSHLGTADDNPLKVRTFTSFVTMRFISPYLHFFCLSLLPLSGMKASGAFITPSKASGATWTGLQAVALVISLAIGNGHFGALSMIMVSSLFVELNSNICNCQYLKP